MRLSLASVSLLWNVVPANHSIPSGLVQDAAQNAVADAADNALAGALADASGLASGAGLGGTAADVTDFAHASDWMRSNTPESSAAPGELQATSSTK